MNFSLEKLQRQNSSFKTKNEIITTSSNSALATLKNSVLTSKSNIDTKTKIEKYSASIVKETSEYFRNNSLELVVLIDKSSSCFGLEDATSRGYNYLIKKQTDSIFNTLVTTTLFNDHIDNIHLRKDIDKIPSLSYTSSGRTRLYDAIISTIKKVRSLQAHDKNKVSKTVVAIMTDGMDVCSHHSLETTRNLIKKCLDDNWEFIFFGALDNALELADLLGIDASHALTVDNTIEGMNNNFKNLATALDEIREYGKLQDNWSKRMSEENNKRKIENNHIRRLEMK